MPRTLIRSKVQVRMVDGVGRVLRHARFMDMVCDPALPHQVRLADPAADELVFARVLLEVALRDGWADDGSVRLHLSRQDGSEFMLLHWAAGMRPFALKPAAVESFLARTAEAIPAPDVDLELQILLGYA